MRIAEIADPEVALERVGGDLELLRELIDGYTTEFPVLLAELEAAVDAGDDLGVKRCAHGLKGFGGVFGAGRAYEAAFKMETLGRESKISEFRPALAELRDAGFTLIQFLQAIRNEKTLEDMVALAQKWEIGRADARRVAAPLSESEVLFEEAEALAKTGGDKVLLKVMVDLFIAEVPCFLSKIEEFIACNDGKALARVCRDLAGRIGAFSTPGMKVVRHLEALGDGGVFSEAKEALANLQMVLDSLLPALMAWSSGTTSPR